eukprot:TRINITY_DN67760_c0_g1_i1.p1 TRINITY_DN67760_c0_g1~~TRINITY_DN67760_c0_g1_i1.p1  ORF type:complete len:333 (+),score=86.08 TRINITY_DN67760_c0_g1_i1:50-1048(+)
MEFASTEPYDKIMKAGSLVCFYEKHNTISPIVLEKDGIFNNRLGAFHHNDIIGKPYGTRFVARTSAAQQKSLQKGWMQTAIPTPELWTIGLRHRTQILYTPDASMIVSRLFLKPGSIVVESGTGSGSLSHYLARAIAPSGHLHTHEFNEYRSQVAREEFTDHGISDIVSVYHRDVCEKGFTETLQKEADAVFLDLPNPWLAVEHAVKAMRPGGRICSFSPCIEQVQRTCETLRKQGFVRITTIETLERTYEVKNEPLLEPGKTVKRRQQRGPPTKMARTDDGKAQVTNSSLPMGSESPVEEKPRKMLCSRPHAEMKGHTGYLTFASLGPQIV